MLIEFAVALGNGEHRREIPFFFKNKWSSKSLRLAEIDFSFMHGTVPVNF